MRFALAGTAVLGIVVLVLALLGARHPTIHPTEQRVFRAINRLPGWLFVPLWIPMQLGNLVVGTAAGLVVAGIEREPTIGIGVVIAAALKLLAERVLRRQMTPYLAVRQRPGTSEPDPILRGGDVPREGMSFPSGHVILVTAIAAVVSLHLPGELVAVAWTLGVVVAIGRVYVGAHNPLDVVAGLGAGAVVGSVVALVLR